MTLIRPVATMATIISPATGVQNRAMVLKNSSNSIEPGVPCTFDSSVKTRF